MRITTLAFFWFPCAWSISFHPLTFSLFVSLGLKWVSLDSIYMGFVFISIQPICVFWLECLINFLLLLFSHVWLFVTLCTAACQASLSLVISWSLPKFMFIALVMLSSHLILWCPLLLLPQSFPASGTFPVSLLFTSGDQNTRATALASVLPANIQAWSPLRLTGLIYPRDFQESSPALQLEDINSLVFCLLYGPALATTCDHWEDHSLDYMDLCQQSNVSAFQHTV